MSICSESTIRRYADSQIEQAPRHLYASCAFLEKGILEQIPWSGTAMICVEMLFMLFNTLP